MTITATKRSAATPIIRTATSPDREALLSVANSVGLFGPDEFSGIERMVDAFLAGTLGKGHDWLVAEEDGAIVGAAYVGPERMTSGTANLYFIGIRPDRQRSGLGKALISDVEQRRKTSGDRILLVETMGIEEFAYQRAFYARCGFHEEARIREFYEAGADKVIFWKTLVEAAT